MSTMVTAQERAGAVDDAPSAEPPNESRGGVVERAPILLRYVALALFLPLVLLWPRLEALPVLAFVGLYNVLLQTLAPRTPPIRLAVAALALDLAAVTAGLALTRSDALFSSAYLIVIAMAAARFQYRGALASWAAAAALYVVFVVPTLVAVPPTPNVAAWLALWLLAALVLAQLARRTHDAQLAAQTASREAQRERQHRESAQTLQQLALELNARLEEEPVLARTLALARRVVPGHSALVWIVEGDQARLAAASGSEPGALQLGEHRALANLPLARHVVESRRPLRLPHLQADPRYTVASGAYDEPQSYLAAPLLVGREALGLLSLRATGVGVYTEEHEQTLAAFASLAALAIHNARLHEAALHRALTDLLTGLPNRLAFEQRLQSELERSRSLGHPLSLLFVDVDAFKEVNDRLGHAAGDEALRAVAVALRAGLRAGDHLARWGGDEFVVLLPQSDEPSLHMVAERLRRAVAKSDEGTDSRQGRLTLSLGGAVLTDQLAPSEQLLLAADRALLCAKSKGGDRLVVAHGRRPSTGQSWAPASAAPRRG